MSDGKPNGEGEPLALVGDEPLSKYFAPAKMGYKVTRQELVQVLALYAQKIDVHEAMKVLDFGLRRAIRETIREEREAMAKEDKSLIIQP